MATKSKQDWNVGSTVKVGFLTLTVLGKHGCEFYLTNAKRDKFFRFAPYLGLESVWEHQLPESVVFMLRAVVAHAA